MQHQLGQAKLCKIEKVGTVLHTDDVDSVISIQSI